ncbi:hypothetical protein [Pelomonas sp. KK5]|uniref:hypothetical protein n=1 Tax=Pelomonas sp. KK5 TaxID=1855730 RepID=UPI00097BE379|nr:hypothetical protein [Pelomonas sp. KK5]
MKNALTRGCLAVLLLAGALGLSTKAMATDWPMTSGDYWDMTEVHLKDGGSFAYAKFLAAEWKADQEFAKSKGWIKGYTILFNAYPRKGEPDLYLVVMYDKLPSGPESDKRADEYQAWKKKSTAQMEKESGDRTEFREIMGSRMLQEAKFK